MSNPLSENTSSNPVEGARAAIGARLDHYHRLTGLHDVMITLLDESEEHRLTRGEFLRATARGIATTARTAGLDETARVEVNEALHFYPVAHRDEWLAREPSSLRTEWEALSAATAQDVTVVGAQTPGTGGQSVATTARALESTPPELHEHTVSIGYENGKGSSAPTGLPGREVQAPDLSSAYITAAQTIIDFAEPGDRIRLRISRDVAVPGDNVSVTRETAHDFGGTAVEVLANLITVREHHIDAARGEVVNVIDNRIQLRQRDPQVHPDREVFVGWHRSMNSFFAQVIDGTDPEGEDVLTVNAGADVTSEITDPRQVIDMVRPYAAIPSDLLNRLTGQQRGRTSDAVPTTAARTGQHLAEPHVTTSIAETDRQRIGRLLDAAAPGEPRPSTSTPPQKGPDTSAPSAVLDVHAPHRGQGYELG